MFYIFLVKIPKKMSVKTCESCVRLCVFSKFQTKVTFSFLLLFFSGVGGESGRRFCFSWSENCFHVDTNLLALQQGTTQKLPV